MGIVQRLAAGWLIGMGCVLPGVSGGVIAMTFGLYRPMLDLALEPWRDTAQKLRLLLPVAIGGALGMAVVSRGLAGLMAQYEKQLLFLFSGFILGGVPRLWQEAKQSGSFQLRGLLLGILLAAPLGLTTAQGAQLGSLSPMQAFLCGVLEGVGTVIPGVSTSFVLIRLGWYQPYLHALSALAVGVLIPIAAGFALAALLCMRAVRWLFDHAAGDAYCAVLGFVLVSVALVLPSFDPLPVLWADAALILIGAVLAQWIG